MKTRQRKCSVSSAVGARVLRAPAVPRFLAVTLQTRTFHQVVQVAVVGAEVQEGVPQLGGGEGLHPARALGRGKVERQVVHVELERGGVRRRHPPLALRRQVVPGSCKKIVVNTS